MARADHRESKSTGFGARSHGGNLSFERTETQEGQEGKRAKGPGRKAEKPRDRAGVGCADFGAPCQLTQRSGAQTRGSENTGQTSRKGLPTSVLPG